MSEKINQEVKANEEVIVEEFEMAQVEEKESLLNKTGKFLRKHSTKIVIGAAIVTVGILVKKAADELDLEVEDVIEGEIVD